jgi:hypothetical protein
MPQKHKTRKGKGFLDGYQLQDTYLQQPDRALGQPGLLAGTSTDGIPVLVKVWPRRANAKDEDLQEIWHHELRQLHRLAGYPGSYEVIAHLLRAGMDEHGFYLVLDLGQKSMLQTTLDRSGANHWLKQNVALGTLSFSSVRLTGRVDCSTSRMISSFSQAGYLMRRPPHPPSSFF